MRLKLDLFLSHFYQGFSAGESHIKFGLVETVVDGTRVVFRFIPPDSKNTPRNIWCILIYLLFCLFFYGWGRRCM